MKPQKVRFAVALAVITFVVGDGLVGVFIRMRGLKGPGQSKFSAELVAYQPHPYRAYMDKPGRYFTNLGITRVVDDNGHQVLPEDRDLPRRPKASSEKRLLFLGGSTTASGWCFPLVALLNREHGGTGTVYKAICAGTGAYTSQENLIDLVTSGFSYHPDMVIAYLPVNDMYRLPEYPDFRRDYSHFRIPMKDHNPPLILMRPWRYPFTAKLAQIYYQNKMRDLESHVRAPRLKQAMQLARSREATLVPQVIDAVLENIWNMQILCAARGVPFVLITQKLFKANSEDQEHRTALTVRAIDAIKHDAQLASVPMLHLGDTFPDQIDASAQARIRATFPDFQGDLNVAMAGDSMHLHDPGLLLFALFVHDYLRDSALLDKSGTP